MEEKSTLMERILMGFLVLIIVNILISAIIQKPDSEGSFKGTLRGVTETGLVIIDDETTKFKGRELKVAWVDLSGERDKEKHIRKALAERFKDAQVRAMPSADKSGWIIFIDSIKGALPVDYSAADTNLNIRAVLLGAVTASRPEAPSCISGIAAAVQKGKSPTLSISCLGDPERGIGVGLDEQKIP